MNRRELILATALSAVWITFCFVSVGGLYALLPRVLGLATFSRIDNLFGRLSVFDGVDIGWTSVAVIAVAMIAASLPISYYWLNRIGGQTDQ